MKKKNKILRTILQFTIVIMIVGFLSNGIIKNTFAVMSDNEPNVIINIDAKGNMKQEGNLFGENNWYPGREKNGIIRINNEFNNINVTNFGIKVNINSVKPGCNADNIKTSFLNNMILTIRKGKIAVFEKLLVNNNSLASLLYDENNNGFILDNQDQFNISKGNFIDLKYTLMMDSKAGDELEDMSADVSFLINVESTSNSDNDDDDDDDDDDIKDIDKHWAHDCIITLIRHNIIKGYPDGSIRPQNYITRAETANLIGKALEYKGIRGQSGNIIYIDSIPDWSRQYVNTTTQLNIFKGYLDQTFKADNNISREEITAVVIRAFKLELEGNIELSFSDKDDISNWAMPYVKIGVQKNIIEGYPEGTFYPQRSITRAEAFTIICKLLGLHDEHI